MRLFPLVLIFALSAFPVSAAATLGPETEGPGGTSAAAAYCVQTGGAVERRVPVYGTNSPSTQLRLAGTADFCQYTSSSSGASRIHIMLKTLYTTQPTLAVLAYDAKVQPGKCNGNPASCYCSLLGGTDLFGGINAAGGGWYLKGAIDETLEACIFPDLSSIDSWGLTYHSQGIIRGIDLSTVVRYTPPSSQVEQKKRTR